MDESSAQKLQEMEVKLDAIWHSVEKTRKHFQITMWVTIVLFVVPLVLMMFVAPMFLNSYLGSFDQSKIESLYGM